MSRPNSWLGSDLEPGELQVGEVESGGGTLSQIRGYGTFQVTDEVARERMLKRFDERKLTRAFKSTPDRGRTEAAGSSCPSQAATTAESLFDIYDVEGRPVLVFRVKGNARVSKLVPTSNLQGMFYFSVDRRLV